MTQFRQTRASNAVGLVLDFDGSHTTVSEEIFLGECLDYKIRSLPKYAYGIH